MMSEVIMIGNKKIGSGFPTFIIAEIGVNHDGNFEKAKDLINAAAGCGANAVKFQSFTAERLVRRNAPKAKYQDRNVGCEISQFEMLKKLELSKPSASLLKSYAESLGLVFISTPYDLIAVDELEEIGVCAHKLASVEVVNHPLIRRVARTGKPVILSVGMASEKEVAAATWVFSKEAENFGVSAGNLILLQCNTNYPAKPEDQHLRAIKRLRHFAPIVGFSDHTEGPIASIAAVALGANVIERHFTLNKHDKGPDHEASMEPDEFASFVAAVRTAEKALGSSEIKARGGELENIIGMRKSICAAVDIPKGTVITAEMLTAKRPGDGLYPTDDNLLRIVGKRTKRYISYDENIIFDDIY